MPHRLTPQQIAAINRAGNANSPLPAGGGLVYAPGNNPDPGNDPGGIDYEDGALPPPADYIPRGNTVTGSGYAGGGRTNYPVPGAGNPMPTTGGDNSSFIGRLGQTLGNYFFGYTPLGRGFSSLGHLLDGTLGQHGNDQTGRGIIDFILDRPSANANNSAGWRTNATKPPVPGAPAAPPADVVRAGNGNGQSRLPLSPLSGGTWGGTYMPGLLNDLVSNSPSVNWGTASTGPWSGAGNTPAPGPDALAMFLMNYTKSHNQL